MQIKGTGIALLIIGILMVAYTGLNFKTKEKVVDLGAVEITKEKSHPVQWSPIIGAVLIVGGIVVLLNEKKVRS